MPDDRAARAFGKVRNFAVCARSRRDCNPNQKRARLHIMRLTERIKEAGAAGYILLWLLGIPIPILLIIFLLRGCS
jgi:hypothetical protein